MNYLTRRSDIDGMRAIAILAVFVFHLNPAWLPGGFVGVDVFFVLSSYLITGILFDKLARNTFSLSAFYANRIKRIVPMATLVFCIAVLIASQLNAFLLSNAKYIPLMAYNSHVASYFAYDEQKNFFLHYWSLAIEEQYYLLWPGIVWGLYALSLRLRASPKAVIFALSLLLVALGVTYGEFMVRDPVAANQAYFFSIPRFAELAIGACVALSEVRIRQAARLTRLMWVAGVLGLIYSFSFLDQHTYPGLCSLVPCLSTALILVACRTQDGKSSEISNLLGVGPLEYIGKISYSLYLWHWLILAVARFVTGSNDLPLSFVVAFVPAVFALSAITYHHVELPFMRVEIKKLRSLYFSALGVNTAAVALVVLFAGVNEFNVPPIMGREYANVTGSDGQNAHLTEGWVAPCWDNHLAERSKDAVDHRCAIGDTSKPPRILMVGDSHAAALGSFIDEIGKREHFSVTSYTVGACQIAEWGLAKRAPAFVQTRERIEDCKNMLDYISDNHRDYDAIFVVNAFNLFSGTYNIFTSKNDAPPEFSRGRLIEIAKVTPLVFFHDGPVLDRSMQYSPVLDKLGLSVGANVARGGESGNAVIKALGSQIPNSYWLDLSESYAAFAATKFLVDKRPVYVDTSHLSGYGGASLFKHFVSQPDNCVLCRIGMKSVEGIKVVQSDISRD
jgi:peptidoglycan/LPS O-acetylase OafA/YrhL